MNRPRRRSKKDVKLKSVQTSTPILGRLPGEKFPSFKRLSIIKAQCERDMIQENKRRRKKSLSISGIYKDTSDQHLEARQRFIKREESDSFTKVFYKRASVEQRNLMLSDDNCDPCRQSRRFSKESRFSLDAGSGSKKSTRISRGCKKSGNSLGRKIPSSISSKSSRKGRDHVGALADVSNFQGDVSGPEVVSEVLKVCGSDGSGMRFKKESMEETNQSGEMEKKASEKRRRASRTRNLTNSRVIRRKPTRHTFNPKDELKVVKRSNSGRGFSAESSEDIKLYQSGVSEKESKTSKERKRNITNDTVQKDELTCENVRSKEALKTIGNAYFGSTQKTNMVENNFQDIDGKENRKIKTLRKRKNTDGLNGNPTSAMNKSTPVIKRAGPKKGRLKKKLWNDPLTENLPLIFLDLEESERINEETETDEKSKTHSEMNTSSSNANISTKESREIMEESNEFLPPHTKNGPKQKKNTTTANRRIFKKPPQEKLLTKVLKKNIGAKESTSGDNKENDPYPSTSTPLDSPVSDCKSIPALFHGLSPVLERPVGFSSVNEPSYVNVTYSRASRAAKESKLDLMWYSFLNLESNSTFAKDTISVVERREKSDGIRLFESPLPPEGSGKSRSSRRDPPSRVKDEVEETIQHESKVSDGVLEKVNQDLEELSDFKLCCESVPYLRHDHLLNK